MERRRCVKRLLAVSGIVVVLAITIVTSPTSKAKTPGDSRQDQATRQQADVPMPTAFRQNQPRHWRNLMLSQSR
jgi:hypothetical protein